MKRLRLKVCGMRDGANIRALSELKPDYVGFIFVETSPRYVGNTIPHEVAAFPSSVTRIGVFRDESLERLCDIVERNSLCGAQLHGDEDDIYLRELRRRVPSLLVVKAIKVTSADDITAISERVESPDLFLLDSGSGGTGTPFDWSWLRSYRSAVPFLLAGGISPANIDDAVKAAREAPSCMGLDINSQFETSPGIKNIEQIKEALARLSI
jgi:phosphoribosylanthranilate isomerase